MTEMERDENGARIRAVGDVFLDRKYPKRAFDNVRDYLHDCDLLIGNQEAALSDAGESAKFFPWANFLYSPPEMVDGLQHAGFDVLSLANNQTMNYGPESLLDTIEILRENDIGIVGAGADDSEAKRAVSRSVNGIDVGLMAYEATKWDWGGTKAGDGKPGLNQVTISPYFPEPHVSQIDLEDMNQTISAAAEAHDVLIVMYHFGISGTQQLAVYQKELAHQAIDHGADAIIGAHSHTLQAIESYKSAPIFYGIGNFVFDRPETWSLDLMSSETIVVSLDVDKDGVKNVIAHPAICDTGPREKPEILSESDDGYRQIVEELEALSNRVDTTLERGDDGLLVPL